MRTRRFNKRRLLAAGVAGGVAVAVAAFLVLYFVIFPTSSPKPLALSAATGVPVSAGAKLSGRWAIASGSVAGYRVREKLGFLPAQDDAVGRTSQITGTATSSESGRTVTITSASFTVAVNTLRSDQAMRDQHIRTIGLQSALYPTATFKLTRDVALQASALDGTTARIPVTGIFTLHGTSRTETLPVEFRLSDSQLQAAGSLTFPWSTFNMTAPSVGGFVSVENHATMEFSLRLTHTQGPS
jgi:polyisoprenoid-binding protein YceI